MSSSGEINELYIDDDSYPSVSFVSEWLNYGDSSSIVFSAFSTSQFNIVTEFAINNDFDIVDTEIKASLATSEVQTVTVQIRSRFIRFSITELVPVCQLKCQGFHFKNYIGTNKDVSSGVTVDNWPLLGAFGDFRVANIVSKKSYSFVAGNSASAFSNSISTQYPDIKTGALFTAVPTVSVTSDRTLELSMNGQTNEIAWVQGGLNKYVAGASVMYRYTMRFTHTNSNVGSTLLVGCGYIVSGVRSDFFGFGWVSGAPNTYDNFGISYTISGSSTFIPRTQFNLDKMDSNSKLGPINTVNLNVAQISYGYLGVAPITFSIMGQEGEFIPVHVLNFPNTRISSTARDPSFGFAMFASLTAGAVITSGNDAVYSASFGVLQDCVENSVYDRSVVEHSGPQKSILAATETYIYGLQNYSLFQGVSVHSPIQLDSVNISVDGTKNVVVRIYRQSTVAASNYLLVDGHTTLRKDEAGNITSYGRLIASYQLSKTGSVLANLHGSEIFLNTNDTIEITAYSQIASEVFVAIGYHNI